MDLALLLSSVPKSTKMTSNGVFYVIGVNLYFLTHSFTRGWLIFQRCNSTRRWVNNPCFCQMLTFISLSKQNLTDKMWLINTQVTAHAPNSLSGGGTSVRISVSHIRLVQSWDTPLRNPQIRGSNREQTTHQLHTCYSLGGKLQHSTAQSGSLM